MTKILNTKILLSGAMIAAAAAVVIGATFAFFSDTETSNNNVFVAGSVDLQVDSTASYLGQAVPGSTWLEKDLTSQDKFFNFDDIKPGDYGENTISLHVIDNDAWMCATIDGLQNDDNGLTDPESEVDITAGPIGGGELAQNLNFFAWLDQGSVVGLQNSDLDTGNDDPQEGDNIWQQGVTEPPLFSNVIGPAFDVLNGVTYSLADSTTPGAQPFIGSQTNYIGLAWCAGALTAPGTGGNMVGNPGLNCDGSGLGNIVQTDSVTADIAFTAVQSRNNLGFTCQSLN